MKLLPIKIKQRRRELGLTQKELALLSSSSKNHICQYETKAIKYPSAFKVVQIAKALDLTVDYLIDDTQINAEHSIKKEELYSQFLKLKKDDKIKIKQIINRG